MAAMARQRLTEERKAWRKDHPVGFFARPEKNNDGSTNLFVWKCGIPGPENSEWAGGRYPLTLKFQNDFPNSPPFCQFDQPLFHPNIFNNGEICLSILKLKPGGWSPSLRVRNVLEGIQMLLKEPNADDPANGPAVELYRKNRAAYNKRIREQALKFAPKDS